MGLARAAEPPIRPFSIRITGAALADLKAQPVTNSTGDSNLRVSTCGRGVWQIAF